MGLTVWPFAAFTPFISTDASTFFSDVQLFLRVKEVQQGQLKKRRTRLSIFWQGWLSRPERSEPERRIFSIRHSSAERRPPTDAQCIPRGTARSCVPLEAVQDLGKLNLQGLGREEHPPGAQGAAGTGTQAAAGRSIAGNNQTPPTPMRSFLIILCKTCSILELFHQYYSLPVSFSSFKLSSASLISY